MGRRVQLSVVLLVAVLMVTLVWVARPAPVSAAEVCDPVTLADLVAEREAAEKAARAETTTTTTPPPDTTATTTPDTTVPTDTTTTTTDTTLPADTTTPDTSPTTIAAPPTTAAPTSTAPTSTAPTTTTTTIAQPSCETPFVYPMQFPLVGAGAIGSHFGADRDGGRRLHAGVDVAAPVLQPVAAVADGTVVSIGPDQGISGHSVVIRHEDGWTSFYIHLNNDTAGTDDGFGVGIRPGLATGDPVTAGEVIGWNGDSGNAENSVHHLHFELHDPDGDAVDPEPSLRAALANRAPSLPEGVTGFEGPFYDAVADTGTTGDEAGPGAFAELLTRGLAVWCDDWGVAACPDQPATSREVSAWLSPMMGDIALSPYVPHLDPLATLNAGCSTDAGCIDAHPRPPAACEGEECEEPVVTEAQLARALAWYRLQQAYDLRIARLSEIAPDDEAAATPLPEPPLMSLLSVQRAFWILNQGEQCAELPDSSLPLTRIEAATWLAESLAPTIDQCLPSSDSTISASR